MVGSARFERIMPIPSGFWVPVRLQAWNVRCINYMKMRIRVPRRPTSRYPSWEHLATKATRCHTAWRPGKSNVSFLKQLSFARNARVLFCFGALMLGPTLSLVASYSDSRTTSLGHQFPEFKVRRSAFAALYKTRSRVLRHCMSTSR